MSLSLPPQGDSQQVMSSISPPQIDIVIPSGSVSHEFESWPTPTENSSAVVAAEPIPQVVTDLTTKQVAAESTTDQVSIKSTPDQVTTESATDRIAAKMLSKEVTAISFPDQAAIKSIQNQVTTEPTPVQIATKPAPDHVDSSEHCGFSVKRSFPKRFQKILVTTRLKRRKPKARMPIDQSDEEPRQPEAPGSPDESDEPPRIPGPRGRSIASKIPSHIKLSSLHDDGQGCWTDEFGYIYRSGIDMSISHLSLGEESRVPRAPDVPDDRVDSRIPAGSLGAAGGFSEKQDLRDDGAPGRAPRVSEDEHRQAILEDQRVFELEAIEAVLESHDVSGDGVVDIGVNDSNDAESSCCDAGGCCSDTGDE
ncbi:hypothetical protein M436DRAFT_78951 [Aureobasidium namibiae CBS 147.97]|uniref:Uncharacterized protein n=1 Tax=Aureobasidium namibiae CBS 147.97 TaxID=1043004 RepID=A0A074X587_9PEZI